MLIILFRSLPAPGCWPTYSRFIKLLLVAAADAELIELFRISCAGCMGPGETGSDFTLESLGLWLWHDNCEPG